MIQLPDIVLDSRLHEDRNTADLVNQLLPIGFHGPPPAVAVGAGIIHIADIVNQDPAKQGPNRFRNSGKSKLGSTVPPKLELHPDPVLLFWQAALCRLVVDPDHDLALLAAMIDGDTGPAVLKALLYLTLSEFTDKLLPSVLVIRIMKQLANIQNPGMVIKSHVQTGDMEAVIL